jgi:hypothetical protein
MNFVYSDPSLEVPSRGSRYDVLLGAVATFEIRVVDRILYREVMFPIAELARALKRWSDVAMLLREPFEFSSLESDESGLVWIRPEKSGWRVGSVEQEFAEISVWSDAEVRAVIDDFVGSVTDWLSHTASKIEFGEWLRSLEGDG